MKTVLHKSETRGHVNHGWLDTYHTFSFASYYNPERIHFGALRVLNDDWIKSGNGFGMHPHDNMEIITIPLSGVLEHKDSMKNRAVIKSGEIQIMSAGTGVFHSESSQKDEDDVSLLQIWVIPNRRNVTPRYDQLEISLLAKENELYQILSPNEDDEGVWIHQNAWFHMGDLSEGWQGTYTLKGEKNGVYVFVIEGAIEVNGESLETRDGLGVWETESITINSSSASKVLLIEVPMQV